MSFLDHDTKAFDIFGKKHPKYYIESAKRRDSSFDIRFVCQCKHGHIFDYRDRELYKPEDRYHAPCQGKCPVCGCTEFSFYDDRTYPIKWNFTT